MQKAFDALNPHDGFMVTQANYVTDLDRQIMTYLYQPIMGSTAFSLYFCLLTQTQTQSDYAPHAHSLLLTLLDTDLNHFYESRLKLEGLGLIKTYQKPNEDGSRNFVYELYAPAKPNEFFNDLLLSALLLEKLGDKQVEAIKNRFKLTPVTKKDYQDVTHNFLEIFHVDSADIKEQRPVIKDAQNATFEKKNPSKKFDPVQLKTFDWEFLKADLARYHVSGVDIDHHQNEIFELHEFYGLDEIDISHDIAMTLNVQTNKINIHRLKELLNSKYLYQKKDNTVINSPVVQTSSSDFNQPNQKQDGFSTTETQWLNESSQFIPADYLQELKKRRNGFVSKNELYALKSLQQRKVFSNDVINILLAYLIEQYQSLTQALLDRVADSWLQDHVSTPKQAIEQIHKFNEDKPKRNTRNRRRNKATSEPTPEWLNEDFKQDKKDQTLNPSDSKLLADRIKNLNNRG